MAAEFKEYDYVEAGTVDVREREPLDQQTSHLMKSEFSTGSKLTLFYFAFIFAMPILNWFAPEFMFSNFYGGMTYAWFFTGIVAMGMAFIIAYIHTALYEKRLKKSHMTDSSIRPSNGRSVN
ncbi:DUF485 domain-containing protein [Metabacillus idriensis]|uniref:hypothetical protein n=1 Tax=Metabacillus idriensis TaxID=324768 RepID=UPI00174BAC60|nr:hypothetical protein [Metabacillus idriensis]